MFAYLWIDRSISLGYAIQSTETANNAVRRLEGLLQENWRGLPEAEVLQKLQKAATRMPGPKVVVKREDGVIWFDDVRFNFEQGLLSSVGDP
mgnify:CR=1 FL=1